MSEEIRINPNSVVYVFEEDCSSWLADTVPPIVADNSCFKSGRVYQQSADTQDPAGLELAAGVGESTGEVLVTLKLPAAGMLGSLYDALESLKAAGLTIDEIRTATKG